MTDSTGSMWHRRLAHTIARSIPGATSTCLMPMPSRSVAQKVLGRAHCPVVLPANVALVVALASVCASSASQCGYGYQYPPGPLTPC